MKKLSVVSLLLVLLVILASVNLCRAVEEDEDGNIRQSQPLALEGDDSVAPKPKVIIKERVVMKCAPGTIWNPSSKRCESEYHEPPVRSKYAYISGDWTSSEGGSMSINQNGPDVAATYNLKNGRVLGILSGRVLNGYWLQSSSDRRCSTAYDGSYYWGRVTLTFAGTSYSGHWSYCNDAPHSPWTGSLVRKY